MLNKEVGYVKLGNSNINIKGSNGIGILSNGARHGNTTCMMSIFKQLLHTDKIYWCVLDPKITSDWDKATNGGYVTKDIAKKIKDIRANILTRRETILNAGYNNIEEYNSKNEVGLNYEVYFIDELLSYYKSCNEEDKKELLGLMNDILVQYVCLGVRLVYSIYRIDDDLKDYWELTANKVELLGIENGLCKMLVNGKEESDKFELYEMKLTTDKEKKSGKTMKNRYGKEVNWMKYIVVCNGKEKVFEKEGACVDFKKKMERKGIKVKIFYEDSVTPREEIFKNKR